VTFWLGWHSEWEAYRLFAWTIDTHIIQFYPASEVSLLAGSLVASALVSVGARVAPKTSRVARYSLNALYVGSLGFWVYILSVSWCVSAAAVTGWVSAHFLTDTFGFLLLSACNGLAD